MENNKRVLLATAICLAILVGWQYLFPENALFKQAKPQQTATQNAPKTDAVNQTAPQAASQAKPDATIASAEPLAGKPVTIITPNYKAVINTSGAVLEHLQLTRFKQTIEPNSPAMDLVTAAALAKAPMGLLVDGQPTWRTAQWTTDAKDTTLEPGQSATLTFTGTAGGLTIVRKLVFNADTYMIDESASLTSATAQVSKLAFTMASSTLSSADDKYNATRAAYFEGKKLEEISDTDKLKEGKVIPADGKWVAVESNYFILALLPKDEAVLKLQYSDTIYRMAVERDGLSLQPGQAATVSNTYYLGPKDPKTLAHVPNNLVASLDYGWFHVVAEGLLWMLRFLYTYVGNYGVAIIILTMLIKLLFWPLSQKSYKSMEKMRKLQPMMAAIREKYPDNREKMNEELMQLYKTYKVNPAGGCLPMVVQIPVFFGLYQALLNAIELRHAPFIAHVPFTDIVWLADLSAKDPFYITPLIMGATMFLQQRMTPAPGDPTQAKVMMFMPVIFTFMFLNFPSGLVIYWLVNNVLSIAQQWMLMGGADKQPVKKA